MSKEINLDLMNEKILRKSVVFTVIFTIIALTVGFITSSQVILFDGIFNLVGIALTYLSVSAMKFMKKKDEWNYPFGKATFEPFIAIVQYAIILYICVSNITSAIHTILDGGHDVEILSGVVYGAFSTIYNFIIFTSLKLLTQKHQTAISQVEVDQWKFSFLLGVGILVGFSISFSLNFTQFYFLRVYSDPLLTIIITLLFGKTALFTMKDRIRELMQASPSVELIDFITEKITEIDAYYQFENEIFRLAKVGNKIIIELDYIIKPNSRLDSIILQDELRYKLTNAFSEIPYEKWININFTGDAYHTIHAMD